MSTVFDASMAVSALTLRRQVGAFVAIAFGWALLCTSIAATSGVDFSDLDHAPAWVWLPLMALSWGPAVAALVCRRLFRHAHGVSIGWRVPRFQFLALGLALPFAYAITSYAITWASGVAGFEASAFKAEAAGVLGFVGASSQTTAVLYALLLLVGGTLAFSLFALGEDIGYSGYLVPTLASSQSFTRTALFTGLIWSAMHYPEILLLRNFTLGTHPLFALAGLTLSLTALAFVMAWLRLRTGSIWPGVVLHASHNVWFFLLLEPLTASTALKPYLSGEHGLFTIALIGVAAYTLWLRRGSVVRVGR